MRSMAVAHYNQYTIFDGRPCRLPVIGIDGRRHFVVGVALAYQSF